jgi:predicted nucleotidyltransferase
LRAKGFDIKGVQELGKSGGTTGRGESYRMENLIGQCEQILKEHYKGQFRGLVLYGSSAVGQADASSDIDLLVLLADPFDYFMELRRIIELLYPIQLESDRLISAKPVSIAEFEEGKLALYRIAKREGQALAYEKL